jgi:hypothetical protein
MPLKTTYVLLDDVVEADQNVRDHSDGDPDLVGSINRFGYLLPGFRDDRTGKLIDGHGRLYRLRDWRDAGREPPANVQVTVKGWKVPLITGWASQDDAEAEAAAVALQPKDGRYNEGTLYEILHRQDDLTGLGFRQDDVADLGRRLTALAAPTNFEAAPVTPPPAAVDTPAGQAGDPTPAPSPDPEPAPLPPEPGVEHDPDPSDPPAPGTTPPAADPDTPTLVALQLNMTVDERRTALGLITHAKERAGLDSLGAALIWALERSPASPSLPEDGARRAADTVRHALKALRDGDLDRAGTLMASLVGAA